MGEIKIGVDPVDSGLIEISGAVDIDVIVKIVRGIKNGGEVLGRCEVTGLLVGDENVAMSSGGLIRNKSVRGEFEVRIGDSGI